jgi:dihydroxyacetone kinase-like protein
MPLLPILLTTIQQTINDHENEVAELDRAIGDGDHVVNLQRGLDAITKVNDELSTMNWSDAFMKIGMTLMSTMGGASGSLFGTLFVKMAKTAKDKELNLITFSEVFFQGVESVQQRGKAELGEKTMLDTLIPVANSLQESVTNDVTFDDALNKVKEVAIQGMESTKDMLATKGRASFLGERAIGHIDAGARTSQLMICVIVDVLLEQQ